MQIEISYSLIFKFGDNFLHKLIVWVTALFLFLHRGQLDHKSELWLMVFLELLQLSVEHQSTFLKATLRVLLEIFRVFVKQEIFEIFFQTLMLVNLMKFFPIR
mgnify:FL=1